MDIFIKNDGNFKLFYKPEVISTIDLNGVIYVDKLTKKEFSGIIKVHKFLYSLRGDRLAEPFLTSTENLIPKGDSNG